MHSGVMKLTKDLVAASAVPLILSILGEGESYGYAIIQRVKELSGGDIEWTVGTGRCFRNPPRSTYSIRAHFSLILIRLPTRRNTMGTGRNFLHGASYQGLADIVRKRARRT